MPLLHLSTHLTPVGQRIPIGHWNIHLNAHGQNITHTFELMLEHERVKLNNPNLVSRLNCVFSFNGPEMENYIIGGRKGSIHHLNVAGLNVSVHNYDIITYFSHLFAHNSVALLQQDTALMRLYWTGNANTNYTNHAGQNIGYTPEHLIGGTPLVINIT